MKNYHVIPGDEDTTDAEAPESVFDREEFRGIMKLEIQDAVEYVESDLGALRAEATARYKGDPYGDEEEGRSAIVDRTIRDTVMQILPSLMRVFAGPKRAVEFEPNRPDAESLAAQRTDYINHVFHRDNPGVQLLYGWAKDALIRKYGVIKVWWEDKLEITNETYTGMLQEQTVELANDEFVTEIIVTKEEGEGVELPEDEISDVQVPQEQPEPGTESPDEVSPEDTYADEAPPQMGPDGMPMEQGPTRVPTYTVVLRREKPARKLCLALVPGEEFIIDRNATCEDDAKVIGHQQGVTRSDLVAMGYSRDFIEEHEGDGNFTFSSAPEALSRQSDTIRRMQDEDTLNPDLQETLYTEIWVRVDTDGDDIAELHKVCFIGSEYFLARMEPAEEIPFAILQADPEPNEFPGPGYGDLLEDIQRINTSVLRATLDSLAQAIIPRMGVIENNVNMMDVLNLEPGAVIRIKSADALQPIATPFVGQAGLQMLEYFRGKTEERGGVTRTSQGLDADALQSTTKAAVTAQMSAAQQRIELIARLMAEGGIKRLFKLMQKVIMRHQDVERTLRLRGKWVTVSPRTWEAELDVRVNVGLGAGPPEERIFRLAGLAEKQELILQLLGPSNPLVTYDRYRNTLAKMVEAGGEDDPDNFFGEVEPGWVPPMPDPPPDPAMILAEAQAKETEAKIQIEQMRMQMQMQEMMLKDQQERAKIAANVYLEVAKLEAQTGVQISEQRIQAATEMARIQGEQNVSGQA